MIIYDLGCLGQPDLWPKILMAIPGIGAAFAVVAGLAAVGGLLTRAKRFRSHDIFAGWGLIAAFMTLAAVAMHGALPLLTVGIIGFMGFALALAITRKYFLSPFWLLVIFPGLFVVAAINVAGIAKWDDFSQWVPNAFYLYHFDGVPGHGMPAASSVWPGYPYALPFLTYIASWLAGGFVMQGGAMINFLLLIAFATMLAEIHGLSTEKPLTLKTFAVASFALVVVTIANPSFNASFTVTSQGDAPTMVLVGALGILLWRMLDQARDENKSDLCCATLAAVALVLIKQSNFVLLLLLLLGFMVAALKNRQFKQGLVRIVIVLVPAFLMRTVWQHYVSTAMDGNGFVFNPLGLWRFDLLPQLMSAMMHEMVKKNGSAILMLGTIIYGVTSIFRPATSRRSFAIISATVAGGYIAFLLVIYLTASFTPAEILRAASFYRYTTHTGLLTITLVWLTAPDAMLFLKAKFVREKDAPFKSPSTQRRPAVVAFLSVMLLPAILMTTRGESVVPAPSPETCAVRATGAKLAEQLPDKAGVVVFEPESDGFFTYIVSFELDLAAAKLKKDLRLAWYIDRTKYGFKRADMHDYMLRLQHDPAATALLVPKAINDPLAIAGYDNHDGPLLLLRDDNNGWMPVNP